MPTVVIDAYVKAFPLMTNRQRASIYKESDLLAPVATQIENAPHPIRIWHFPGLPRDNYAFVLDEIDGGGAVVQNLAEFDLVPGALDSALFRGDEQYKVGTTPGFDAGLDTVTFDGTGGKPDFRNWEIVPSELTGRGILVRGLDYSWDKLTGIMVWLQAGDILQDATWYNFKFDPIANTAGGSEPTVTDFSSRLVTATGNIEVADFGNTVIVEPEGPYIELTLPDITTVPQGRPVSIETIKLVGSAVNCIKIIPNGADIINFLQGDLYMMNNESLQIYRFRRDDLTDEWRVRLAQGNFYSVGESIADDAIQTGVYCKQALNGSSKDKFQYARYYNEVVLRLPATQRVNYDDWATGNNKYLHSLANSGDLGNADKFYFPDRRDLFERNNNAGKAGDYQADTVGPHLHPVNPPTSDNQSSAGRTTTGNTITSETITQYFTGLNTGTVETRPKNYLINKYVRI